MRELTTRINALVDRYSGSKAELARQTGIDRSTLYKILNGQRLPTEAQLQSLLAVLSASQEEYAAASELFAHTQHDEVQQHRIALLQEFVSRIFAPRNPKGTAVAALAAENSSLPEPAFLFGEEEVRQFLTRYLLRYLRSESELPLMLSPLLNDILVQSLSEAFSAPTDHPKAIWHLCLFEQESSSDAHFVQNVQTLTRIIPLLFARQARYEARLFYAPQATVPGQLLPVYILFPDLCLFLDTKGQYAVCVRDRQSVDYLRLQYSRQYLRAPNAQFLNARHHSAEEGMLRVQNLVATGGPVFLLRDQPPLIGCLDRQIILQALRPEAESAAAGLTALLERQKKIAALHPDCYFSESGVLRFLRTGLIDDIPGDLYYPLRPEVRKTMLRRLRDQCADGRRVLRLLNGAALPVSPGTMLDVYRNCGVLICHVDLARNDLRQCFLQDRELTRSLYLYLSELRVSQLVSSQKYTLEFLDYCLQTAE